MSTSPFLRGPFCRIDPKISPRVEALIEPLLLDSCLIVHFRINKPSRSQHISVSLIATHPATPIICKQLAGKIKACFHIFSES